MNGHRAQRLVTAAIVAAAVAVVVLVGVRQVRSPSATDQRALETISIAGAQRALRVSSDSCRGGAPGPAVVPHVMWIWMENHSLDMVDGSSGAPYLDGLGAACGVATAYQVVAHPSLPNYLAATSGLPLVALRPFVSDCEPASTCRLDGTGMFGIVPSWKAYQESMPTPCAPASVGNYLVRHNPPAYYAGLTDCARFDVPYQQLATDLAADQLPAFSFVTPDRCHDMHNCSLEVGDSWLSSEVPKILASPAYRAGQLVVFITFDEGKGGHDGESCIGNADPSCRVLTTVVSPWTTPGTRAPDTFTHYSLLRTTLELLGVTTALGEAASAPSMRSAFNL